MKHALAFSFVRFVAVASLHHTTRRRYHMAIRRGFRTKPPKPPNKALEPTSTSVTPRALSGAFEMKHRTGKRPEARVAPAVAVAHL